MASLYSRARCVALLVGAVASNQHPPALAQLTPQGAPIRLSTQGTDGDITIDAANPTVAFAPSQNEFLVAWSGGLASGELEIFAQRMSSAGTLAGVNFPISTQGPDGDPLFNASDPAISFNPAASEYLAVWEGDLASGEKEIFGQRIGSTGNLIGSNFQISVQGPAGNAAYDAFDTSITYNSSANEFLVVWEGDLANNEFEVFGQRVSATGGLLEGNFRISAQGVEGDSAYDAVNPVVGYSPLDNQYLVAWHGDRVPGENEIYGQRVSTSGALAGGNFRISAQGNDGNTLYDARNAAIAYNLPDNEFFVVWEGDRIVDENEIYGQRIATTGDLVGAAVRVSTQGVDDDIDIDAFDPAVTFNSARQEYLVSWRGDIGLDEFEIHGQRVSATASLLDGNVKLSNQGPPGNPLYDAVDPALGFDSNSSNYLALWKGDLENGFGVAGELEVFGQLLTIPATYASGDFDNNGVVDAADLTLWQHNFGSSGSAPYALGDGDGDGDTEGADFLIWQQQLGMTLDSPWKSTAKNLLFVPEPGSLFLAVFATATLFLRSRRSATRMRQPA